MSDSPDTDIVPARPAAFPLDPEPDLMRAILHAMPDLVFFKDAEGIYRGTNARTEAYYGLTEDEIVGRTDEELNPPEVAAQFRAVDLAAMAARRPVLAQELLTFADGHVELSETTKTPLYLPDGRLMGILGVGHDITARHAAEEAVRAQEEMFEAIVNGSAEAMALTDAETGRYVQFNDAACATLGYTREELSALSSFDVVVPTDDLEMAANRDALDIDGTIRIQSRHRRKDGEVRDVELSLRAIPIRGHRYHLGVWHDITERLRRERDLAASERLLQEAQAIGLIGSWTWDPKSGATTASAEAMRLYGLREPPGELWATVERVVLPEDLPRLREQMRRLVDGDEATRVEYRIRVDGTVHWIESLGRLQHAADGSIERIVGISQEVTRSREAAEAIVASEARYHSLFDTAAVSIMIHDPETGATIDANARALEAYGATTVDELDATRVFASDPPYSSADAVGYMQRALAEGRQTFEWRSLHGNGSEFWEHVILEPVQFNGRTVVMSVSIDVTDTKIAEQELEFHRRNLEEMVALRTAELAAANRRLMLSDQRLSSMLDLSTRAELLDEKSLLRHGLEEAVRLTGSRIGYVHFLNGDDSIELVTWSRDTLAQCDALFENHYPLTEAGVWADSARLREPVIHNDWETTPNRKGLPEGHIPLSRHLGVPVIEAGHVRMLLGVGNKATPYDDGDADELRLVGMDLYRIAMRRRAEIALEHAKEAAELASRAKSTFLANMSHEIRTPMNAIIGLAHLMRAEPVTPRQEERLEHIAENAEHLLKILNDVLDLSKIEAGKLALEPSDFSLSDVLEHLRSIEAQQAASKGLRLTLTVAPDVPTAFHGDGLRLAQVLVNLVNNALKFTAAGGVDLTVTRRPDKGAEWIRFSVRDSGIGIAPYDLERLFGSFEQADASTTRRYGGSGLGLSICRSLVELMGGAISVESRVAEGSAFTVDVPLPPADLETTPELARARPPASRMRLQERSAAASRPGARVLLAEDSLVNRQVAAQLLQLADVEVDTASDGREAVEAAVARRYDLVLMDVQMPILDGLAATREIRRLPGWADVPIVAMTANAFEDDRQACLDAGMNDHLAKPVDPDRLYATLERWVPKRASSLAAAARSREPAVDRETAAMRALLGSGSGRGVQPAETTSRAGSAVAGSAVAGTGVRPPGGGSATAPSSNGSQAHPGVASASNGTAASPAGELAARAVNGSGTPVNGAAGPGTRSAVPPSNGAKAPSSNGSHAWAGAPESPSGALASGPASTRPTPGSSHAPSAELLAAQAAEVKGALVVLSRPTPPGDTGEAGTAIVDVIAAIRGVEAEPWLAGDVKLRASYLALLGTFARDHASDVDAIGARIAAGQWRGAARATRTLEQVAAGLGLVGLERAAASAAGGMSGQASPDAVAAGLEALRDELSGLLVALQAAGLRVGPGKGPQPAVAGRR